MGFDEAGRTVFSLDGTLALNGRSTSGATLYRRRDTAVLWSSKDKLGRVTSAVFSNDGRLFAIATEFSSQAQGNAKGQIEVRDTRTFAKRGLWQVTESPYGLSFSPDNKRLAVRYSNDNVSLKRLAGGNDEWWYRLPTLSTNTAFGSNGGPRAVAFSHDGRFIAAASASGSIAIWKVNGSSVAFVVAEDQHQQSDVHTLLFSRDGKTLWSFGSKVNLWRAPWNFTLQSRRVEVSGITVRPGAICMSQSGKWIAAAEKSQQVKVWRVKDGVTVAPTGKLTPTRVAALGFLPDDSLCGVYESSSARRAGELFSSSAAALGVASQTAPTRAIRSVPAASNEMPLTGAWAEPEVTSIAAGTKSNAPLLTGISKAGEVFLYSPRSASRRVIARISGRTSSVEFAEDGKRFGVMGFGGNDREQRWEWITSAPRRPIITPLQGGDNWWAALPRCVVRGRTLLVGIHNGAITGFDGRTHLPRLKLPKHGNRVATLAISPTGLVAVAYYNDEASAAPGFYFQGDAGTTVSVWNLATGKKLYTLPDRGEVRDMEFSPDGRKLAIGPIFPPLQLRETRSGKLLKTAQFYRGGIVRMVFSADGSTLRGLSENIYQEWRVR
jgi:WD40 repeat protein